jgi:hypothetical protein
VVPFELAPKGIDGRPVFNSRADVSWAGFVPVADEHRGTYDREDDGGVDPLAGGERGCGRKYQQQEQRASHLIQEELQASSGATITEGVGPVLPQAPGRFG